MQIEESYRDFIIPVDESVTARWGEMRALLQCKGITLNVIDGLLAATCDIHSLIIVPRNDKDFFAAGIAFNKQVI